VNLLLDTQILVWMINGDGRLRQGWIDVISSEAANLYVSAVVAFEYTDLQLRRRLPVTETIDEFAQRFDCQVEALPVDTWRRARALPSIHRDPVDRMLIAHALQSDMTLMTADANIRRYPVPFV
jgi:PIN domain nuclease of toxin-antitoxin system